MLLIRCTCKLRQEMGLKIDKLTEPVEKPTEALAEESSGAVTLSLFQIDPLSTRVKSPTPNFFSPLLAGIPNFS